MAPPKKINFNEYWPFLRDLAERRGLDKGEWFQRAGIAPQRYSGIDSGTVNLTARYYLRLLGGLHLTPEAVERLTGIHYDQDQIDECTFQQKLEDDRDWLLKLYSNPERLARYRAEDQE